MQDSVEVLDPVSALPPTAPGSPHLWIRRVPRLIAWVLLLVYAVSAVGIILLGERKVDFDSFETSIASGDIDQVEVTGAMGPDGRGYSTPEFRWSDHGLHYVALARQTIGSGSGGSVDGDTGRVRGDVITYLHRIDPSLRVESGPYRYSSFSTTAFGWQVGNWLAGMLLVLVLGTLGLLSRARDPWRATTWAWFWLVVMLPGFGAVAYLVAGGPTGLVRRPEAGSRPLTGGWSFLLALVLVNALNLW